MIADWLLIAGVIALLIASYWAVGSFIDNMLDYWRNRDEYDPDREQTDQVADAQARLYEVPEHRLRTQGDQRRAARQLRRSRARRR